MTQQEKDLLLKDICSRLPYHLKCIVDGLDGCIFQPEDLCDFISGGVEIKPYLRPMSSMTEEEKKKLKADTCPEGTGYFDEKCLICPMNHYCELISYEFMSAILDWLNKHMFDFRGLIPLGLALEAPEGMYK